MMYGGQAIIKGVMMRSPRYFAVSCRRANTEIQTRVEPIVFANRPKILRWPMVRGTVALLDAMLLGVKALFWSASLAMEDAEELDGAASRKQKKERERAEATAKGKISDVAIGGALVVGLGLGVFLFIVLPNIVAGWLHPWVHGKAALNIVEGILKVVFFLAYVAVVGRMRDIREVFQYHGAEHRAINTFEAGRPLDFESTRDFGTIHVRCGTNFILIVLVVSIFVFAVLPWNSVLERVMLRLLLLPVVAGIAYEIIRFAGRRAESRMMRTLLAPGLALQHLTTRPPQDDQVEVALAALNAVIEAEAEGVADPQAEPVIA